MKSILLFGLPGGMELIVILSTIIIIVAIVVFVGKGISKMMK